MFKSDSADSFDSIPHTGSTPWFAPIFYGWRRWGIQLTWYVFTLSGVVAEKVFKDVLSPNVYN